MTVNLLLIRAEVDTTSNIETGGYHIAALAVGIQEKLGGPDTTSPCRGHLWGI